MHSMKSTLCSTQCDRVESDSLLIVDSYKYTKYTKTCQLHYYPVFESVTRDIVVCHMESIPEYWLATE